MSKPNWDSYELDDLIRLRDRKVRRQVRFQLYAYSPFYRKVFDDSEMRAEGFVGMADLAKLPLVTRAQLAESPEDFVLKPTKPFIQRWSSGAQLTTIVMDKLLRGLDFADQAIEHDYQPVQTFSTAGASADPLIVSSSRRDVAVTATHGQRLLEVAGASKDDRVLNLLEWSGGYQFWTVWAGSVALGSLQELPGLIEPKQAADLARERGVTVVAASPEDALSFLEAATPDGLPSLKTVILGSQPMAAGLIERIRAAAEQVSADARVVATYGFTEARAMWAECREGAGKPDAGFHASPDLQVFEVASTRTSEPVKPGEPGELVFTALEQRGTALARYRTGDQAAGGVILGACPYCGRVAERILGPIRRASNLLEFQLAGGPALAIDVEELVAVVAHPGVSNWQIEVNKTEGDTRGADELFVLYKPKGQADPARIAIELDRSFRRELGFAPTQFIVSDRAAGGVLDLRPILVSGTDGSGNGRDNVAEAPLVRLWRKPGS